jgi:predicted transcriptional regulator of viral defense system
MKIHEFFTKHPVFTLNEFDEYLTKRGRQNLQTRNALLKYHQKTGHIISVRRGLYTVIPTGALPENAPVDPFLLAGKITPDAVLAYHTALEFHGKAYSTFNRFTFLSSHQVLPLEFRNFTFKRILTPQALRATGNEHSGVITAERQGVKIKVTSLERAFVDVLDRPDLCGSWEEIWRSLESIEFFDIESVVEYARLLENATTAAKVGFFLEQHKDALLVDDKHLKPLLDLRPRGPHYLERSRRKGSGFISKWNLVVPREILDRSWEEVA